MIGNLQFQHTSIVCKNLQKELVTGLDTHQLYQLDCDWTDSGHTFLHPGTNVLINLIDVVTNVACLRTTSNIEIPAHSLVTRPSRKKLMCTMKHSMYI